MPSIPSYHESKLTTESRKKACVLASKLEDLKLLPAMRVIPGSDIRFIPSGDMNVSELDLDSQKRATGGMLYDLFIPESFACCPHPTVRNRPDGHITGDLFEEVAPGYYAFRRNPAFFYMIE